MDESKAPLTEPAPLYPAYNPTYNPSSYQMQPVNATQQGTVQVPLPEDRLQEKKSEKEENKNTGLDDGDDLYPGSNPGQIPDKHFNLDFEHCFTEHKSTQTFSQLYKVVGIVYKYTKLAIYHIFVIFIGIPMAILWAFINGIMMFVVVWLWGPVLKIFVLWVFAVAPAVTAPIQAFLAPLADVVARIFRQIRVRANINGSLMKTISPEHIA